MEYFGITDTHKSIITSNESHIDYMHTPTQDSLEYLLWDMGASINVMWAEEKTAYGYTTIGGTSMWGMFVIKEMYDATTQRGYVYAKFYRCQDGNKASTDTWFRRGYLSVANHSSDFRTYYSSITWGDWIKEQGYEIKSFPLTATVGSYGGLFTNTINYFYGAMYYNADTRTGRIYFNTQIKLQSNINVPSTDGTVHQMTSIYLKLSAPSSEGNNYITTLVPYIHASSIPVTIGYFDGYSQMMARYDSSGGTNSIRFNMLRNSRNYTTDSAGRSAMTMSFDQLIYRGW